MKNKRSISLLAFSLAVALLLASTVLAQTGGNFDLSWWTVDGGGEMVSGGSFSLTGTVGQPEPGPTLSSGSLSLTSGFWPGGGAAPPVCPVPLLGVTIVGPASGYTNVQYTFTAQPNPANPTEPITYTWSTDGLISGQGTVNAVYSWGTVGPHSASVTAQNCGGTFSDDHTITLSEPPPTCDFPLTGFEIDGPTIGEVGQNLSFTSRITPSNATEPIAYTWSSDGLVSGQGTNTAVYSWSTPGQQQIVASASNCGGSANDSHAVALSETPPTCPNPLTGVSLSGPSSGETDQTLTFTASPQPANATAPITYTWSADGLLSGQGTSQATYRWTSTGSKTVQVSARNCGGQDYSDSQAVTISAACAKPLVDVSIAGLTSGYVNVTYEFTALPDPSDATIPITYTWSSDGLVGGQGTAQATYSWSTTGTHTIYLTATNCGGSASDEHSITLAEQPADCDFPITGVSINGPTEGDQDTDYTFAANVQPANATEPINYTWSAGGLVSGQGTSQTTYRWSQSGIYDVSVSVGNCGGSANDAQAIEIGKTYTYLPVILRNSN